MTVYYTIRNLAYYAGLLRVVFLNLAIAIDQVWLLGDYLAYPFYATAERFAILEAEFYNLSGDWYGFYTWLIGKLDIGGVLASLEEYAEDLISFIRDPDYYFRNLIYTKFPALKGLFEDPIAYVLEVIIQYTGFDYDFIFHPVQWIEDIVNRVTGSIQDFISNPHAFIVDRLSEIMPTFYDLITDARRWVVDRVVEEFPYIYDLLSDPQSFIEDRIMDILENVKDRYEGRILKLVENILQAIF